MPLDELNNSPEPPAEWPAIDGALLGEARAAPRPSRWTCCRPLAGLGRGGVAGVRLGRLSRELPVRAWRGSAARVRG